MRRLGLKVGIRNNNIPIYGVALTSTIVSRYRISGTNRMVGEYSVLGTDTSRESKSSLSSIGRRPKSLNSIWTRKR